MDRIENAIEQFMYGFAFLQQYADGFDFIEDAEWPYFIRSGKRYEFIVYRTPVSQVAKKLKSIAPSHNICFFPGETGKDELQAYKDYGYRQKFTEFLMQIELENFKITKSKHKIKRACSEQELLAMSKAKGWGRKYEVKHLGNENVHTLYIELNGEVVAGGNLVLLPSCDAGYVEDVFTCKDYQRKGLGTALMCETLRLCQQHGLKYNTLVSFGSAGDFYKALGYQNLSDLKMLEKKL